MTTEQRSICVTEPGDVWFFAYGSLMWDPGFRPVDVQPAVLYGWHRSFCVWSERYRGTKEVPGLVLGLDRGGSCRGRALLVAEADRERVFEYLAEREMPEGIYACRRARLGLPGGRVGGYTLVVNRDHCLYAGRLPAARIASAILGGNGERGPNRDYLASTVRHLDALGIGDGPMHRLLDLVEGRAGRR